MQEYLLALSPPGPVVVQLCQLCVDVLANAEMEPHVRTKAMSFIEDLVCSVPLDNADAHSIDYGASVRHRCSRAQISSKAKTVVKLRLLPAILQAILALIGDETSVNGMIVHRRHNMRSWRRRTTMRVSRWRSMH